MESYKTLIKEFGERLNLRQFEADEQGYIAISFANQILHLQYDSDLDEVVVFARAGKIQPERMADICPKLLAANMFWQSTQGATFSIEPNTGIVFLADRKGLALINVALLNDWLERFLNITNYWRERLDAANSGLGFDSEMSEFSRPFREF